MNDSRLKRASRTPLSAPNSGSSSPATGNDSGDSSTTPMRSPTRPSLSIGCGGSPPDKLDTLTVRIRAATTTNPPDPDVHDRPHQIAAITDIKRLPPLTGTRTHHRCHQRRRHHRPGTLLRRLNLRQKPRLNPRQRRRRQITFGCRIRETVEPLPERPHLTSSLRIPSIRGREILHQILPLETPDDSLRHERIDPVDDTGHTESSTTDSRLRTSAHVRVVSAVLDANHRTAAVTAQGDSAQQPPRLTPPWTSHPRRIAQDRDDPLMVLH